MMSCLYKVDKSDESDESDEARKKHRSSDRIDRIDTKSEVASFRERYFKVSYSTSVRRSVCTRILQ